MTRSDARYFLGFEKKIKKLIFIQIKRKTFSFGYFIIERGDIVHTDYTQEKVSAGKVGDHNANIVRGIFVQQVEHKIIIPIGYALGCPRFPRHAIAIQANEYASLRAILGLVKIF